MAQVRSLAGRGRIAWTDHALEKMASRAILRDDVVACLKGGSFTEDPHVPNKPGALQYKFTMQAIIEGELIEVAASLKPQNTVVVITAF